MRFMLLTLPLALSGYVFANDIANLEKNSFNQNISSHQTLSARQFADTKKALWSKYRKDVLAASELKTEFDNRALIFQDKTMRFSLDQIGTAPEHGYPLYIALHGGGQTSPDMNDSQWDAMKTYYQTSVANGVYIAPRGITDTWKLHSEDESYPLYDKLIEGAILYANVDPNRVYLMGFSAGGDGVYQIVPRMPARFAAANMSAGHHNWITFDNLHNTPFLLQVGELDAAYDRNHVAAKNNITLNQLHEQYGSGFTHDVFIHYNGSHNGWRDNDSRRRMATIIADPIAWLDGNRATTTLNTNAVDWMNQFVRDPIPTKIVWDLNVGTTMRTYQTGASLLTHKGYPKSGLAKPDALFYWLDVSQSAQYPANGKIVAEILKASNRIDITEIKNIERCRILLSPTMLDLTQPIQVVIDGKLIGEVSPQEKPSIMTRTLLERSDNTEIYDAEINLEFDKATQQWIIKT